MAGTEGDNPEGEKKQQPGRRPAGRPETVGRNRRRLAAALAGATLAGGLWAVSRQQGGPDEAAAPDAQVSTDTGRTQPLRQPQSLADRVAMSTSHGTDESQNQDKGKSSPGKLHETLLDVTSYDLYRHELRVEKDDNKTSIVGWNYESGDPLHITDISSTAPITFRVKLSPNAYNWLTHTAGIPNDLIHDIDKRLDTSDPFVHFVRQAVTDKETGQISEDANDMLLKLLSLPKETHELFISAIADKDQHQAQRILLHRSETPITKEIFDALKNFITQARKKGYDNTEIKHAFHDSIDYFDYTHFTDEKPSEASASPLMLLIPPCLSQEQFTALQKSPVYLRQFLGEYIVEKSTFSYQEFLQDYIDFLQDPKRHHEDYPIPAMSPDMLALIQKNLDSLVGTPAQPGWLADKNFHQNALEIIELTEMRERLAKLATAAQTSLTALQSNITHGPNGEIYFTFSVHPDQDTMLSNLNHIMRAAEAAEPMLEPKFDENGHPTPLIERAQGFLSANYVFNVYHTSDPHYHLDSLGEAAQPSAMAHKALTQGLTGYTVSEETVHGIRVFKLGEAPTKTGEQPFAERLNSGATPAVRVIR